MKKNPSHKDNIVALRRIEGQVRGVQKMIEDGKYCIDILNQINAVKGALGRVEEKILKKHYAGWAPITMKRTIRLVLCGETFLEPGAATICFWPRIIHGASQTFPLFMLIRD